MANTSALPAIPPPSPSIEGLLATVTALKMGFDSLSGQAGGNSVVRVLDFQRSINGALGTSSAGKLPGQVLLDNAVKSLRQVFTTDVDQITAQLQSDLDTKTQQIADLQQTTGANGTAITDEASARATEDTALGDRISNLVVVSGAGNNVVITDSATASANGWQSIGVRISSVEGTVGDDHAYLTDQNAVLVGPDLVLSGRIATAQAQLDTATASGSMQLIAVASPQAGVAAEFSVNVSANNGQTFAQTGLRLRAMTNGGSEFAIQAGKFIISSGSSSDGTGTDYVPFSITANGLESLAKLNGSLVVSKTITADAININTLDALTANVGTLTAGLLQSPNGKMVISLTDGTITGYA